MQLTGNQHRNLRKTASRQEIAYNVKHAGEPVSAYAVFEIETPKEWEGRTVAEVDVRRRYNVNILGVKSGEKIVPLMNPDYRFQPEAHLIVAGEREAGVRLMNEKR